VDDDIDYSVFIPLLCRHLRENGVVKLLLNLVESENDHALALDGYNDCFWKLLVEEYEVDIICEIVHWACMASTRAQNDMIPRLPIFLSLLDKYRSSALRALIGIIFNNPVACKEVRKIGLPEWQPDVDTARVFELITVIDKGSRKEVRPLHPILWETVENVNDPDLLAAVLHILAAILIENSEQPRALSVDSWDEAPNITRDPEEEEKNNEYTNRLHPELHEVAIQEQWVAKCVSAVKKHPFIEAVQQFGIELITIISATDTTNSLISGAHVLARVASEEFPTNNSIRASRQILNEMVDPENLEAWKYL